MSIHYLFPLPIGARTETLAWDPDPEDPEMTGIAVQGETGGIPVTWCLMRDGTWMMPE